MGKMRAGIAVGSANSGSKHDWDEKVSLTAAQRAWLSALLEPDPRRRRGDARALVAEARELAAGRSVSLSGSSGVAWSVALLAVVVVAMVLLFVALNLIIDLTYAIIDPRIGFDGA